MGPRNGEFVAPGTVVNREQYQQLCRKTGRSLRVTLNGADITEVAREVLVGECGSAVILRRRTWSEPVGSDFWELHQGIVEIRAEG